MLILVDSHYFSGSPQMSSRAAAASLWREKVRCIFRQWVPNLVTVTPKNSGYITFSRRRGSGGLGAHLHG